LKSRIPHCATHSSPNSKNALADLALLPEIEQKAAKKAEIKMEFFVLFSI